MSFQDTAVIAFLVLLLFGPKKLPELARQLGKLMGEFRRASNEFRMQMEDELRIAEQADQQKKIAAMEAASPVTPALPDNTTEVTPIATGESSDESMHENTIAPPFSDSSAEYESAPVAESTPLPIATSGDLNLMPPATGLPEPRSGIDPLLDAIPRTTDPQQSEETLPDHPNEATYHG